MRARLASLVLAASVVLAEGNCASAHLVTSGLGPFYDGMLHSLTSVPTVLAVSALTLLAARCGPACARAVVLVLPATWLLAAFVGWAASLHLPAGSPMLALFMVGALAAAGYRPSPVAMGAVTAIVALVFGLANGAGASAPDFEIAGFAGTTLVLFVLPALTSALILSLDGASAGIATRIVGSWIAAIALLLLGFLLSGRGAGPA
jgi:hypothetical protein